MRHCERDLDDCSFESTLLPEGVIHSKQLCKYMNKLDITLLYSSPFLRAIQTLEPYSLEKNLDINIDYSLAEYVDTNDKHLMSSVNNYIIPNEWRLKYNILQYNSVSNTYNVDESLINLFGRLLYFMSKIIEKYKNSDVNILLSTHMSIVNVLIFYYNEKKTYNNDIKTFNVDEYYPMGKITELNIDMK